MQIRIKRIYEPYASSDGYRILVDRLWPRGIKKEDAHIDLWMKEIAPSNELRKWFGHIPAKWPKFREKYRQELAENEALPKLLEAAGHHKAITLLYAAKDEEHNDAVVLKEYLSSR
jgi:uncharacterized protein YeaO (DUF488 family)